VTNEEAHRLAREKGVSRPLYAAVRAVLTPLLRGYFRMRVSGADHIPASGPAIVVPNHKSFWDSFFVALCTRRHLRFMAKSELIEGRFGRLLVRLGAFPVRRGQSDEDALDTAREILRQGELLALGWGDVDLVADMLTVRRSLSMTKAGFVVKEPKTREEVPPSAEPELRLPANPFSSSSIQRTTGETRSATCIARRKFFSAGALTPTTATPPGSDRASCRSIPRRA